MNNAEVYNVVFRIRMIYLMEVMKGRKKHEVRGHSPRWGRIAMTVMKKLHVHEKVVGVFLSGKTVHRREIITVEPYATAEEILGRTLSEQGIKDVGTGPVWAFELGDEVNPSK